jgi:hypothetical protein
VERPALHHDVLVIVSGGSVTTRTDPDEEPDETEASCCVACAFAAAI